MNAGDLTLIDLATTSDFWLGAVAVRPSSREVEGKGQTILLEPRVMQVLVALAQQRGRTVTRDMLIARCWDGVAVGEDAIQRCIGRLRKTAEEVGGFTIETLSRIGYKLHDQDGANLPSQISATPVGNVLRDARPSLIVLDVRSRSLSNNDHLFAEALAEEISGALSLHRDLRVIARSVGMAMTCCRDRNIEQMRAELGVSYFAEGAVRRVGDALRVSMQLNETSGGRILWTHQVVWRSPIDAPYDDLVIELAGHISGVARRRETKRVLDLADDLTPWEALVRAMAAYQRINQQNLPVAVAEAERAILLQPDYAAAHATLANALAAQYEVGGGLDQGLAHRARHHADHALNLDAEDATVLSCAANAIGMLNRAEEALPLALRAIELEPAHAFAHLYLARIYLRLRRSEEALAALSEHERMVPQCPWQYFIAYNRSLAHFMAGAIEIAARELDRSLVMNPAYPYAWLSKAILCVAQARNVEAFEAAQRLQGLEGIDSLPLQCARIAHSFPDPELHLQLQGMLQSAWHGTVDTETNLP